MSEAASLVEVVHGVLVTPPGRGITSGFGAAQPMLQPV